MTSKAVTSSDALNAQPFQVVGRYIYMKR